jgi:hypothetical protein
LKKVRWRSVELLEKIWKKAKIDIGSIDLIGNDLAF